MNASLNNFGNLVAYFHGSYVTSSRNHFQGYTANQQAYVVVRSFGYGNDNVFLDTDGDCEWLIEVTTKDTTRKFSLNNVHWEFPVGGSATLVAKAKNGRTVKAKHFNTNRALSNFYHDLKKLYIGEYPHNFLLTVLTIATHLTQEYDGTGISAADFFQALNQFAATGDTSVFDNLTFIEESEY